MPSSDFGKDYICTWIRQRFPVTATILDVGACDGKWRTLLDEFSNMDAVEIFPPSAEAIKTMYRNVICSDIDGLNYGPYDLIIFGDVIEHMTVEKAQRVLSYAKLRCKDMIVGVPYRYPQGPMYGNEYERHIQDDLTEELFMTRYKGLSILIGSYNYGYFHKEIKK